MNYKEFVQQAAISCLPGLSFTNSMKNAAFGAADYAKALADQLVEQGLLDPPASTVNIKRGEPVIDFFPDEVFEDTIELPAKSCDKSCGPSDYEAGGMCDRNGCYKPKPDEITWLDVIKGRAFQTPGNCLYYIVDVLHGIVYWNNPNERNGYTPINEFIRNMNAVGAREVKA